MADFKIAFAHTSANEGGYVFDKDDAGGETYRGVARRFNPSWKGWRIIDHSKSDNPNITNKKLTSLLSKNEKLQDHVGLFYKRAYWDKFWGDEVPDQDIANELFDTSVNLGVRRAVKFVQESVNLLNRNQKNYKDTEIDGYFGRGTLKVIQQYLAIDNSASLLKIMNTLQGMHYINYMRKNPTQEKYARGWFKRT